MKHCIDGATRRFALPPRKTETAPGKTGRTGYALPETIARVERAVAFLRERGSATQACLSRLLGYSGSLLPSSVLMYITEHYPAIGEDDSGALVYAGECY